MNAVAERVARNEAAFRSANDRIEEATQELQQAPFLCECSDPTCTATIWLTFAEYEAIRQNPRWFVNAVGHEANSGPWGAVVDRRDRYVVAEKVGEAGAVAEQLAERKEQIVDG